MGRNTIGGVDGRIDVDGLTIKYLSASNAPHWQTMPIEGPGFFNYEANDLNDKHDFGTSWLGDTIVNAAVSYKEDYMQSNPNAAVITINDVTLPKGGDTPDHAGHETGLACDLRLPRKDGGTGGIKNPNTNNSYDRDSMRAQLIAIRKQPLFNQAFFNDRILIQEGLCKSLTGHNNHVHFDIKPPVPI